MTIFGKTLHDIIWAHKGQFFSVEFLKKDNTIRKIHGQVGYKPGHDGDNTVAHLEQYVTVIEKLPNGLYQHRNVNLNTITRLAVAGKTYEFTKH
jgi:hypothetical protein